MFLMVGSESLVMLVLQSESFDQIDLNHLCLKMTDHTKMV